MKIIELSPMFEKQITELYKRSRVLSVMRPGSDEPVNITCKLPLDCDYYSGAFVEINGRAYYVRFSVNEQNLGCIVHFCVRNINDEYFQGSVNLENVPEEDAFNTVFEYVGNKILDRVVGKKKWREA